MEALENPDQARSWSYRYEAWKTPEVASPEALEILEAISTWKKMLGWLSVVGVHIALRKQWLRHKLSALGEHLVYLAIIEGVCYAITGHEVAWWIGQGISRLK